MHSLSIACAVFLIVVGLNLFAHYLTKPEPTKNFTINCVEVEPIGTAEKSYQCKTGE